ncbi:MAG TPA: DUF962 domain-containing protein [Dongiaceae bacterium]|jgi:hypothetical protein|nr:DUF962 domain-containing protein [Dongiaceae bacterium]
MTSFKKFWPLYLRAHRDRGTRIGHYYATTIALSAVVASIAFHTVWVAVLGILVGYGIALTSHRIGDRSKSLVFVNPVWGAVADLKMCWLALSGSLAAELAQHAGPSRDHVTGSMAENPQ